MASDVNVVVLVGRLTRDCNLRYTGNGSAFVSFTIAVNRSKRSADGKWDDEASFIDCVYFGNNSQSISQYLQKGRQVAVQGELRQSKWSSQDGQQRSRLDVVVNSLSLLSSGQGQTAGGGFSQQYSSQRPAQQSAPAPQPGYEPEAPSAMPGPESFEDDSIPF